MYFRYFAALLALHFAAQCAADQVEVVAAGPAGFTLEFRQQATPPVELQVRGERFHHLPAAGPRTAAPGSPDLPFVAELISVPPGARIRLEVLAAHYRQFEAIDLLPVASVGVADDPAAAQLFRRDPQAYARQTFAPSTLAAAEFLGIQRGAHAHRLHLYPFSYKAAARLLRVYDRITLRVHFEGGGASRSAVGGAGPLYDHFLNPTVLSPRRGVAKSTQNEWYEAAATWVKLTIDSDGFFRIDRRLLEELGVELGAADPRTFRLLNQGREQAIYVAGEQDGSFDAEDFLQFYGQFRRDDRDFDSIFGRRNTYWLTWSGDRGQRFVDVDGAPANQFPVSTYHRSTAHFEQDLWYDPLPDAPDNRRDHWYWDQPVFATKPDVPSSRIFARELLFPDLTEAYTAHIEVALHGTTNLGHHTVVKLNNTVIDDAIWEGQVERRFEREIPSSYLRDGVNRVLLQSFADQAKWDKVFFNWFTIEYRKLYRADRGFLSFQRPATPSGERLTIEGFRNRDVHLFDLTNGIRFTNLALDSTETGIAATFEHRTSTASLFAVTDSLQILRPTAVVDTFSAWRTTAHEADYIIITHPLFAEAAKRLAQHRRRDGLQVSVVSTTDIYDEFSHGLFDRAAVKAFIQHSYDVWPLRPAYVLLFGDATFDYRNLFGSGIPSFVPSSYYHARNRGHAPSDVLYAFLEGDDLLPDLAIGRLAVATPEEAAAAVEKIVSYDTDPEPGAWRSRVVYGANYHVRGLFTEPSDRLAASYTEPLGLQSIKVYNEDNTPIPNVTGRRFLDALNDGALLVNFNGHGSSGTMQFLFSLQFPDWDYLSQLNNGRRLPLVLALSCLNGMFANPHVESLGEVFTDKASGGSIAYISASAESFVAQNKLLGERLFEQLFKRGNLEFGPSLNAAKTEVLAAHSSFKEAALTMQLFGDPAQRLALQTAPDFVAEDLRLDAETLFTNTSERVELSLDNHSITTADSLLVLVLAHAPDGAAPDTLHHRRLPGFIAATSLTVPWPIGPAAGDYRLEVRLDPDGETADAEPSNNSYQRRVEVLEPLIPTPAVPRPYAALPADEVAFTALLPLAADGVGCEFAFASSAAFDATETSYSPVIALKNGVATYEWSGGDEGRTYFWRARVVRNGAVGPWCEVRSFSTTTASNPPRWRQIGAQFDASAGDGLARSDGEAVVLNSIAAPLRITGAQRENWFTVSGLAGAGIVCSDGTYLYAKRWFNDATTIYPGSDQFTKIGTGFNGTSPGRVYGVLADSTTAGIAATYHGDGFIYNESGRAFELERMSVQTGRRDTVAIPDGLLEWKYGQVEDGHSLISSDGVHIYNVSMSSAAGTRNEWRIRVFDPANGWELLRDFTSPPTETGFTYRWTDGILTDSENIYLIEFSGGNRVRRVDAFDGGVEDEWIGDQDSTRIVAGQFDWINNKVWLGDLYGPTIYRYAGGDRVNEAELLSPVVGPAAAWQSVVTNGTAATAANLRIDLLAFSAADSSWAPLDGFADLPIPATHDISSISAATHRHLRLRARFVGAEAAELTDWSVQFTPLPSLEIVSASGDLDSVLRIEAAFRSLEPVSDEGVVLQVEDAKGAVLATVPIANFPPPGAVQSIRLDSLALPAPGERRFVRISSSQPDADPRDNWLEVALPRPADPRLTVTPSGRVFQGGDFLGAEEGLWIHLPSTEREVELLVDGAQVEADSVAEDSHSGQRLLLRPDLAAGRHVLLIRTGAGEGIRAWSYQLWIRNRLSIARPLVYPHPVSDEAEITFSLSQDAAVTVQVFSLSGRLVRHLSAGEQAAGFCTVRWDGRDEGGARAANGTYIYRIQAESGNQGALVRAPLTVVR